MDLLKAIVVGIVQGITEFLPISSTAHLKIIPSLLGWADPGASYSAIIQLGTTAAVLLFFSKDILRISRAWLSSIAGGTRPEPNSPNAIDARMGWYVIAGTIPVVIAGLVLKHFIENQFRSLYVIAATAILMAVLLAAAEKLASHKRSIDSVTLRDGVIVGLAQAVALVPGASRSGMTLTAGLFVGLERAAAARFSFLLSIPATVAAGLFEMRHVFEAHKAGEALSLGPVIIGTAVSFVVGYLSIAALLRFLRTRTTLVFVIYRVLLGIALFTLLSQGILQP